MIKRWASVNVVMNLLSAQQLPDQLNNCKMLSSNMWNCIMCQIMYCNYACHVAPVNMQIYIANSTPVQMYFFWQRYFSLMKPSSMNKWPQLVTVCSEIWILHSLKLHFPWFIRISIANLHVLCICVCALYPIPALFVVTECQLAYWYRFKCFQLDIRQKYDIQLQFPTSCIVSVAHVVCSAVIQLSYNTGPFLEHDSETQLSNSTADNLRTRGIRRLRIRWLPSTVLCAVQQKVML